MHTTASPESKTDSFVAFRACLMQNSLLITFNKSFGLIRLMIMLELVFHSSQKQIFCHNILITTFFFSKLISQSRSDHEQARIDQSGILFIHSDQSGSFFERTDQSGSSFDHTGQSGSSFDRTDQSAYFQSFTSSWPILKE